MIWRMIWRPRTGRHVDEDCHLDLGRRPEGDGAVPAAYAKLGAGCCPGAKPCHDNRVLLLAGLHLQNTRPHAVEGEAVEAATSSTRGRGSGASGLGSPSECRARLSCQAQPVKAQGGEQGRCQGGHSDPAALPTGQMVASMEPRTWGATAQETVRCVWHGRPRLVRVRTVVLHPGQAALCLRYVRHTEKLVRVARTCRSLPPRACRRLVRVAWRPRGWGWTIACQHNLPRVD